MRRRIPEDFSMRTIAFAVVAAVLLAGLGIFHASSVSAQANIEEIHEHEADVDNRTGSVAPTAA